MAENSILFTPAAVLGLLSKIEELQDKDIGISETLDGNLLLTIGDSKYEISSDYAEEVEVSDEAVDAVEEINEEAYSDLGGEDTSSREFEYVASGVIKEFFKTLLVGGMVRLTNKWLRDDSKNKKK